MANRLKVGGEQDGQETMLGEDNVVELCRMGVAGLRTIIRPDTTRVAEAFDDLMATVKVGLLGAEVPLTSMGSWKRLLGTLQAILMRTMA